MKTFTFNLLLTAVLVLLLACEEDISSVRTPDVVMDVYSSGKTTFQSNYVILRFDLSGRGDGSHRVGKNPYTGSGVNILIREGKVAGFQVFRKDGSLVQPHGTSQGPGTPDHSKKPQIICKEGVEIYYDPEYGYLFKQHGDCDLTNPLVEIIIDARY